MNRAWPCWAFTTLFRRRPESVGAPEQGFAAGAAGVVAVDDPVVVVPLVVVP
jgi:hypothetical protein